MKQNIILFIGLTVSSCLLELSAQDIARQPSSTRYIRDLYQYVHRQIDRQQYYVNELKINSGDLLWANDKKFQSIQRYHYSFGGDDSPVLRMVSVIMKVEDKNYYAEYLYDNDGKLIFCYEKQNDEDNFDFRELHAYYEEGLCVNLLIDSDIIDAKDAKYNSKLKEILRSGNFYGERFLEDMQIF